MTVFEEIEKLKDEILLSCEAFSGATVCFKKGVPLIPEPFLETTIRWAKEHDATLVERAVKKYWDGKINLEKRCYMTPPQLETIKGMPQLLWATFVEDEDIFP